MMRLVFRLLGGERVEIGVGLGIRRVDLVELRLGLEDFAQALLDRFAHRLVRRRAAAPAAGSRCACSASAPLRLRIPIVAGHDAQQARLARAVESEHADLGAGEERQRNVLEDHSLGRHDLAHAVHGVDVLSHGIPDVLGGRRREDAARRDYRRCAAIIRGSPGRRRALRQDASASCRWARLPRSCRGSARRCGGALAFCASAARCRSAA